MTIPDKEHELHVNNNWTGSLTNLLCLIQNLPENLSPAGQDDLSGLDVSQLFQDRSTDQIVIELLSKDLCSV